MDMGGRGEDIFSIATVLFATHQAELCPVHTEILGHLRSRLTALDDKFFRNCSKML